MKKTAKLWRFLCIGLVSAAVLAPLAQADEGIDPAWYYGGADGKYALKTREYEANFSYTPSPEDWRDRNIYQLFTDRFATDGNCNLTNGYKREFFYKDTCHMGWEWTRNFHQGGNWRGLRQQIGYLTNMGVTAVWISGVQLNDQAVRYGGSKEWRWTPYHQYHVDNFFSCDPASGTFQELKDLIDDLHRAHIAVILDVAPNHMCDKAGRQGNNGNDDKYYTDNEDGWWWDSNNTHPAPFNELDRFHRNGTINNWDTSPENLKGQFKGTDDLKQEDGTTSTLLEKAFKNLIDATDCDGFRVDAIKHIPYDWCRNWAQKMRDHAAYRGKKNFLVFGELFSYSHDALAGWCSDGYGFNSSLDFPLMQAMNNAFGNGYSGYQLGEEMGYISSKYGKSAQNVIAFLDNHDVNRFAFAYGGGSASNAKRIMSPAMTFLYLAPPIPLLYYGTEHMFNQGGHGNGTSRNGDESSDWYNPDDSDWQRECMFNPETTWGQAGFQPGNAYGDKFDLASVGDDTLYWHIRWLNGLRNKSRALRRGGFQQRACVGGQGLYAFTKWYDDEVALVLINTSDSEYSLDSYDGGWLDVGISDSNGGSIKFYENGDTSASLVCDSWGGRINLQGVKLAGKGSKVLICNPKDNSSDVFGEDGGGSAATLWVRNTYGWPTENATLADTIYINTEAGNADNVREVEVFYKVNPKEGETWPGTNMVINADWDSEKGKWWHLEIPAEDLDVGELQYCVCVRDTNGKEVWDNNGGGNYVLQLSARPADIGATFASVTASPTEPNEGDTATITVAMEKTGNDISQLTVKMTYAFEEITGTVGAWQTVTMTKGTNYENKTYFTNTVADLPGGKTLLYKLEASNGTADTIQANSGNAYRLKIAGSSSGMVGNCWHCPTNHEPASINSAMRAPATPKAGSKMALWMGNYQGGNGQYSEGSNEHDPFDMTGGKVWYRFGAGDTWSAWASVDLGWSSRGGNNNYNNYWSNTNNGSITVPQDAAGKFLQYYFTVNYTNNEALATPTYLYMNPDNSGSSLTTTNEATAQATPFEVGIAATVKGSEPGFIRHAGNITRVADNKVQIWATIGYQGTDGTKWADEAVIRYRIDIKDEGTKRSSGVKFIKSKVARAARSWKALTSHTNMTYQGTIDDSSGYGKAMTWMGTIEDDLLADPNAVLIYEVYARNTQGTGLWKQAEYNAENGSCTFEYRMFSDGSGDLTVNGTTADYTTSKFFLDEADPDDEVTVEVAYHAPDDADIVELFTNFGRRDFADVDEDGDGWPDGMIPPAGTNVTAAGTYNVNKGYWQAVPMKKSTGAYVKTLTTKKCGVYRITARYGYVEKGVTNWTWYSQNPDPEGTPRRDHVVVISPKKAMQQTMYELNVLTTKATGDSNDKSGNFEDLSERLTATSSDPYGEFSIDYLNRMGINCLWFQPIHPNLNYARGNTDDQGNRYYPGSPYATKNYFSVNYEMTKTKNTAGLSVEQKEANAVAAFTNFVRLCDLAQTKATLADAAPRHGTINVMLDGVMNHTSFDAVFGDGITLALAGLSDKAKAELTKSLGSDWDKVSPTNVIPSTKLGLQWYSHVVDDTHNQAAPATRYVSVDDNDIANAPERYDFGKWNDVAELLYGDYSTMVKFDDRTSVWVDPGNGGEWYEVKQLGPETSRIYSEEDQYYYGSMLPATKLLWKYMASYPEYWIKKTGNDGVNHPGVKDGNGILTDDYGIDGLRCDYAQGLPNQFWEYCINRTRSMKWNFLFMAESLDGGPVGFRSNRQFDILNENMVFRFTQDHVSDPWQFQNELENRRNSYGDGLILLNETCHDEVIPWGDPQVTASRYAMVSAIDGVPMIFYGQEQGISTFVQGEHSHTNGSQWVGFQHFEQNFGKWIPHFKRWNQMRVWTNQPYVASATNTHDTAYDSRAMAAFYGRINQARQKSPALQSRNRWFLNSDKNGNYIKKIMFCAKWEEAGKSPKAQDAVFAAVLFVNDSMGVNNELNQHWGEGAWYDISPFAAKMGIENRADKFYNVVNLASTDTNFVWTNHISGKELYTEGINVTLLGTWEYDKVNNRTNELAASVWTDNGYVAQFLKVYDVTDLVPPVAPDGLTINDPADELHLANGTTSYEIIGMAGDDVIPGTVSWTNTANGSNGTFAAATVWTQNVALVTGTNVVTFTAATKGNATTTIAEDKSSNQGYSLNPPQEYNGLNGGTGFGAWTTLVNDQPSASQQGIGGHWTDSTGFGVWCNLSQSAGATRALPRALKAGDVFSIDFYNDWITTLNDNPPNGKPGGIGVALCCATNADAGFRMYFNGGDSFYQAMTGPGEGSDTTLRHTSNGVHIEVTMTSDTAFTATMTAIDGSGSATYSGSFSAPCDMFRIWNWNNHEEGANDYKHNIYVNNLKVVEVSSEPAAPATATATIVVDEAETVPTTVEIVPATNSELTYTASTGVIHFKVACRAAGTSQSIAPGTRLPVYRAWKLQGRAWNWTHNDASDWVTIDASGEATLDYKMDQTENILLISIGQPPNHP